MSVTYGSHLADGTNSILDTTLGAGWTHGYGDYLLVRGSDYIWVRESGEIVRFTRLGAIFRTSTGQFYTLKLTSTTTAEARTTDGTVYKFRAQSVAWTAPGTVFVLDRIVDRNLHTIAFTYSGGFLTGIVGPYGQQLTYQYNAQKKLVKVITAGREVRFEYTSATGQLSAIVLPNGQRVQYTYNALGQLVTKKVPDGGVYTIDYNAQGKAYRLRDPAGVTVANQTSPGNWAPDRASSLASGEMRYVPGSVNVTDGRGNVWKYDYDGRGCVTKRTNPAGGVMPIEYDSATVLPKKVTDENGHVTEYQYDARGNRTLMRDAELNVTTYQYDPVFNQMTMKTEPDGDTWVYVYDAAGNLIQEIDPLHEVPTDATTHYSYTPDGLLSTQTDRIGNTTAYQYDAQGNTIKLTDPAGAVTNYSYDPVGNRISQTVHNTTGDQVTTYTYDPRNRMVTETNPVGTTTKYDYDPSGNHIRTYTGWTNDTTYHSRTDYQYDTRDRLIETVEDSGGVNRTTQYQYDGNSNRVSQTDPNGHVTTYQYDSLNRQTRTERDPGGLGIVTQYQYDGVGNRISTNDPNGHITTYQYDALDRLTRTTDAAGNMTQYGYAPPGGGGGCACGTPGSSNIKCITDAEGKVTRYEYDQLDRRVKEIHQVGVQDCNAAVDADDAVTTTQYDPNGNRLAVTDPNGNSTTYTYTARNEVASSANGAGETTTFVYDAAGNRTEVHPPNGNTTDYAYDAHNRLIHVSDAVGDITVLAYDAVGNRSSTTDALGHATFYAYDRLERPTTQTDPMGQSTITQYDAVGNVIKITDREGHETIMVYDAANRRVSLQLYPQSGGPASTTQYQYDAAGNVIRRTDANGHATQYTYDATDRCILETNADGTAHHYSFNGLGRVLTREDDMGEGLNPGNITSNVYDDLNRLIRRDYATGDFDAYVYDAGGRLLSADNLSSHVGFTYDAAGRVLTTTQSDLPVTYLYTLTYAYDVAARTRTLIYPNGKVVTETHDLRDRLADVADAGGLIAHHAYDLANRIQTKDFGNGTQARYTYNANNWMTELRQVAPDTVTTFAGFAHDYDREGHRLNARNLQGILFYADARPVTHSEKYGYDDTYRLNDYRRGQWAGGDIPAARRHRTWQLDPVNNWYGFGIQDSETGENTQYCNAVNQMNEYDDPSTDGPPPAPDDDGMRDDFMVSPCPPTGIIGTGYNNIHDKNGNLLDDGTFQYFYDGQTSTTSSLRSQNQLTMVKERSTGNVLVTYRYDALGRRMRQTSGPVSTVIILTADWREIEEYDNGTWARSYVYGVQLDELLSMDRSSIPDRLYYHLNAVGSVIALTNSGGAVAERYTYDAYGSVSWFDAVGNALPGSQVGNTRLFTGRPHDGAIGLSDLRARLLKTNAGRFTTRDPLGSWADSTAHGNGYSYAGDDPINLRDPLGLKTEAECCDKAKADGKAGTSVAGVICCDCPCKKISCVWISGGFTQPTDAKAKGIVDKCGKEHEDDHHDDIDCPAGDKENCWPPTRPNFSAGKNSTDEEKKAYSKELACLKREKSNCGDSADCKSQVDAEAQKVEDRSKTG